MDFSKTATTHIVLFGYYFTDVKEISYLHCSLTQLYRIQTVTFHRLEDLSGPSNARVTLLDNSVLSIMHSLAVIKVASRNSSDRVVGTGLIYLIRL